MFFEHWENGTHEHMNNQEGKTSVSKLSKNNLYIKQLIFITYYESGESVEEPNEEHPILYCVEILQELNGNLPRKRRG